MFEFLRCMYKLGRLDDAGLYQYVRVGRITQQQYREITGKEMV